MRFTTAAAVFMTAFMCACLQPPADVPGPQRSLFRQGERQMRAGRMDEARETFETFRGRWPHSSLADDARFLEGFILVSSANPRRNYDAALRCFMDVEEMYTQSEWLEEARTWRMVLERLRYLDTERPAAEQAEKGGTSDAEAARLKQTLAGVRRTLAEVTADRDRLAAENKKLTDVLRKLQALDR